MSARVETRQEMTAEQRAEAIASLTLSLRLDLLHAIRGFRYEPAAQCPNCRRQLTPLEILKGFNANPQDFTTECSECQVRFKPKLKHHSRGVDAELPFYCSIQAREQLRNLSHLSPEEIQQNHPAVYHSVIVHHGTLKNAFSEIPMTYQFEEAYDWKDKVVPFLGRLPDKVIAEIVGMKPRAIGRLRKKHGIPACTKESMMEEIYDADHN